MNAAVLLRLLAWSFALLLLALPVVGVLNGSFASERWPLRQIDLQAELDRVELRDIQSVVAAHAGKGFFALSLVELRQALAALPWVQSVEVRKRWPDTVAVRLLEYQPYAIWADRAVVSRAGHVFTVPGVAELDDLPRLWGPDERVAEVVNFHAESAAALARVGLVLRQTWLLPRGSWQLELDGGTELALGRDQVQERLQRFTSTIAPVLRGRPDERLRRADLRYPNGYALVWAEPEPAASEPGADPRSLVQEPQA